MCKSKSIQFIAEEKKLSEDKGNESYPKLQLKNSTNMMSEKDIFFIADQEIDANKIVHGGNSSPISILSQKEGRKSSIKTRNLRK